MWFEGEEESRFAYEVPHESSTALTLLIRQQVLSQIKTEIAENGDVEVGGKFVGYVDGPRRHSDLAWQPDLGGTTARIEAYIDSGPKAKRSATHHTSDLDYQQAVFDKLASRFADLQFLGMWHSHHPNGLRALSGGDVETGLSVVNSPNHELDFLISSLATDGHGLHPASHHVFIRGQDGYELVAEHQVHVLAGFSNIATVLNSWRTARTLPSSSTSQLPAWCDTRRGRAILAADRRWLREYPGMRTVLNNGELLWRGVVNWDGLELNCAYVYGTSGLDHATTAIIATTGEPEIRNTAKLSGSDPASEFRLLLDSVGRLSGQLGRLRGRHMKPHLPAPPPRSTNAG